MNYQSRAEKRALKKHLHEQGRHGDSAKRNLGKWIWLLALLAVLFGIGFWVYSGMFAPKPGIKVAIQSREHIFPGSKHDLYTSNPPVSGPHHPSWSECGVFENELPMETLIHNMEHGHVVVLYKPDIPSEEKEKAKTFVEKRLGKRNILMASNKELSSSFALAAWGWYQLFEKFDEQTFEAFYKAHRYSGPERIPCNTR